MELKYLLDISDSVRKCQVEFRSVRNGESFADTFYVKHVLSAGVLVRSVTFTRTFDLEVAIINQNQLQVKYSLLHTSTTVYRLATLKHSPSH